MTRWLGRARLAMILGALAGCGSDAAHRTPAEPAPVEPSASPGTPPASTSTSPPVPSAPAPAGALRGAVTTRWGEPDTNRCVPDVPGAVARLPEHGAVLGFHIGAFTNDLLYFPGSSRHWQGVQRVAYGDGRGVVVSRGGAPMFASVRFGSRGGDGLAFGANRASSGAVPDAADRIVAEVAQVSGFEHAGGVAALGLHVAVPLENGHDASRVVFYDLADSSAPAFVSSFVRAPDLLEAGAVALTKLANGAYLMAVAHADADRIAWYVSPSVAGWSESGRLGVMDETGYDGHAHGSYQTVALVTQCDGALFLLGTHDTSKVLFGEDHVDAWRVVGDGIAPGSPVTLAWAGDRHVTCSVDDERQCNFAAGAGVYVDPQGRLIVQGVEHQAAGPSDGDATVKMMEFAE